MNLFYYDVLCFLDIYQSFVLCFSYRTKSGIWGWRADKTEVVNGFEAKV